MLLCVLYIIFLHKCCFIYLIICLLQTAEAGVIERFGQFKRLAEPGCVCVCWPIEEISGKVSLRLQQLNVVCETKTKDNVRHYNVFNEKVDIMYLYSCLVM